jgi:regulator of replication initiation timing
MRKNRVVREKTTSQRLPATALFESLAESRVSVLYLARRAQETKDTALAKELTEKGQSLKIEIARIRRTLTADWTKEAAALLKRSKTAQSELAELAANMEKSARKTKVLARALDAVSNVLAVAKKVL